MGKTLRVLLWTAIVVGTIVGLLRAFAVRWWRVPEDDAYLSASLTPTAKAGDLLVFWRLTKPAFGDLVLCPDPEHNERIVIGRIVGEENDHVKILGSRLSVNGKAIVTETNCDKFKVDDPQTGIEHQQTCEMEVVGSKTHMRGEADAKVAPLTVETDVPAGKVYLISDNRQFPYDSRDYGPVERSTCKETVIFRLVGIEGYGDPNSRFTFIR